MRQKRRLNATAAVRMKSDSKPVVFTELDLREILGDQSRSLSYTPPLDFLNVSTVRNCMNEALRGAYAQVQWIWEQLEPADAVLASCVEKRDTALKKLPWRVVKKQGLSDLEDAIADAQLRTAKDFCNAITNMDEAIAAFGQASFRHFKRIQMVDTSRDLILQVTDNWNWSRDGYGGDWQWNPRATFGTARAEEVPVPEWTILTRLCPRPIDQVAMMLCLDRKNAKAQWMTCNGRYGTPPFFVVMPEGTDEDTKELYLKMAMQCISNSCGTLPPGADIKAVSVPSSTPDMFQRLIDLSTQELVLRSTNGMMTMLTAPGAGTNTETGSTHEDGFDDLAAAEGKDIAGILNRGMIWPIIEQWHPGQDIYVELEIKHPEASDTLSSVSNITQLAGAGYRTSDEQVKELTGYEVKTTDMTGVAGPGMGMNLQSPALREIHSRYAPTMLWPTAREEFDRSCRRKDCNSQEGEDELSRGELEALTRMMAMPDEGSLGKIVETLQKPLEGVLMGEGQDCPQRGASTPADPLQNSARGHFDLAEDVTRVEMGADGGEEMEETASAEALHDTDLTESDEGKDANGKMSRSEAARHAAMVRWGEGRIGRNRGNGREGETKSGKSNTPLRAGKKAKTKEKVEVVEKAIKKTAKKGGSVKTGVKVGKNELVVEHGSPGEGKQGIKGYGSSHATAKHFATPQDSDVRKAARAIVSGIKSKDAKSGNVRSEYRKINTVLGKTHEKGTIKMITAHKKKK